ncbi:MAG: HAD family hydrolase [Planctomycetota bacterium]|nr:HAD family hydrolase [Planctomycetota bacterium]
MLLTVFDIDGTLCRTSGLDDACWCQAAREVLAVQEMSTDWSDYPHSTDEAIASALIREHHRVEPDRVLLDRLRDHFVSLLEASHARDPSCIQATPGACQLLSQLSDRGQPVAIATGGWTASARFKLAEAGIDWTELPAAYACDAHPREEIISLSIRRAARMNHCEVADFSRVVYVGDGLWDLRAADALGISFLGIASGERARLLEAAGAHPVFEDFTNLERILPFLSGD